MEKIQREGNINEMVFYVTRHNSGNKYQQDSIYTDGILFQMGEPSDEFAGREVGNLCYDSTRSYRVEGGTFVVVKSKGHGGRYNNSWDHMVVYGSLPEDWQEKVNKQPSVRETDAEGNYALAVARGDKEAAARYTAQVAAERAAKAAAKAAADAENDEA